MNWKLLGLVAGLSFTSSAYATVLSGNMTADDNFYAFLGTSANSLGAQIGSGGYWGTSYPLTPTALTPGVTNYLNIEAINTGGPGAISFVLHLSDAGFKFANGSQSLTSADVGFFTASYNNTSGGGVQTWVPATGPAVLPPNVYPYGNVVGVATWADASSTAGQSLNTCNVCTVDFTIAISPTSSVPEASTWVMMMLGFAGLGFARYRTSFQSAGRLKRGAFSTQSL